MSRIEPRSAEPRSRARRATPRPSGANAARFRVAGARGSRLATAATRDVREARPDAASTAPRAESAPPQATPDAAPVEPRVEGLRPLGPDVTGARPAADAAAPLSPAGLARPLLRVVDVLRGSTFSAVQLTLATSGGAVDVSVRRTGRAFAVRIRGWRADGAKSGALRSILASRLAARGDRLAQLRCEGQTTPRGSA